MMRISNTAFHWNIRHLFFVFIISVSILSMMFGNRLLKAHQRSEQNSMNVNDLPILKTHNQSFVKENSEIENKQRIIDKESVRNNQRVENKQRIINNEKLVLIAVNENPSYLFSGIISALFWKRKYNFSSVFITVGPEKEWNSDPLLLLASKTFEQVSQMTNSYQRIHLDCPKSISISLSQTVRVFASLLPQLQNNSWMMIADSDWWTIDERILDRNGKSMLFTNVKQAGDFLKEWKVFMYNAHHIGMFVSQWRSLLGLPLPKNQKDLAAITTTYVQNFFGLSMRNLKNPNFPNLQIGADKSIPDPTASSVNLTEIAEKAISNKPPATMTFPPDKVERTKWYMDQYLLAWHLDKFPLLRTDAHFENESDSEMKMDVWNGNLTCEDLKFRVRDVHIKYSVGDWNLIRIVFVCFTSKEDLQFIDDFQKKLEIIRKEMRHRKS